jgi:hypothetical protein
LLFKACQDKLITLLQWLVTSQSPPWTIFKQTNSKGYNCLHFAASVGFVEGIKLLLRIPDARSLLQMKTNLGKLPIDLAVQRQNADVQQLLSDPF